MQEHKSKIALSNVKFMKLTCESFNPNRSANFFLSGLLMYFWIWNRFSKPFRCESTEEKLFLYFRNDYFILTSIWQSACYAEREKLPENTALLIIPRRDLPLVECAHGKPCPNNGKKINQFRFYRSQNTCLNYVVNNVT